MMRAFNLLSSFEILDGFRFGKSFLFLTFNLLMVHFDVVVEMYFGNTLNLIGLFAAKEPLH